VEPDLTPDELTAMLAAHLPRLRAATLGVPADVLRTPPAPDPWSAVDVLAHLQECADVWGDSMRRILAEEQPRIRYVSPRSRIGKTEYRGLEFAALLERFVDARSDLLAILRPLPADGWERSGTVTRNGRTAPWTLRDYVQRLATHEADHVGQVERLVG
jgi:hypothetical protein